MSLNKLKDLIDEQNYPYFTDQYLQSRIDEIGSKKGVTLESIARELYLLLENIL